MCAEIGGRQAIDCLGKVNDFEPAGRSSKLSGISMSSSKAILVSQDPSLMEAVREAIASTRGIRLEVLADIDTACNETLEHDQILVTLVHLDGKTNVSGTDADLASGRAGPAGRW